MILLFLLSNFNFTNNVFLRFYIQIFLAEVEPLSKLIKVSSFIIIKYLQRWSCPRTKFCVINQTIVKTKILLLASSLNIQCLRNFHNPSFTPLARLRILILYSTFLKFVLAVRFRERDIQTKTFFTGSKIFCSSVKILPNP